MKLNKLAKKLSLPIKGMKEIEINGISSDSRTVSPGNLFIAKRGISSDGARYIPEAVRGGAAAVVTDIYDPFLNIPQIIHPNPAEIEARLAAYYYGEPSKTLFVAGVTGTKGKTTTSYLIKHLFDGLGKESGLIGTIETIIGSHRFPSTLTTHDPVSNQKWLKEMVQKNCQAAVLEASSHGLSQGRLDEIHFDLAIFTNLYPDHLDYHGTMEEYAKAKKKLFERAEKAILNGDSPWSESMGRGVTFGIDRGDLRAERISLTPNGAEFFVGGELFISPLIGRFNIYNCLAAIAAGLEIGGSLKQIQPLLADFPSVPARLERIGNVFIDFAHTKEALENALQTLKEISKGKVVVVFGCGGNRDPQRRIGMGQAAARWADVSIVTNDNPRNEDPEQIAREISAQFNTEPLIELDRRKAIQKAIDLAGEEDLVLIAGKGHEKVQIFGSQTIPFDDGEIVREILNGRTAGPNLK